MDYCQYFWKKKFFLPNLLFMTNTFAAYMYRDINREKYSKHTKFADRQWSKCFAAAFITVPLSPHYRSWQAPAPASGLLNGRRRVAASSATSTGVKCTYCCFIADEYGGDNITRGRGVQDRQEGRRSEPDA